MDELKKTIFKQHLKEIAKRLLRICFRKTEKSIEAKIDGADVVSFDLYDTLICRESGRPQAVFYKLGENAEQKQNSVDKDTFVFGRISAERKARSENGKEEITLFQIYNNMEFIPQKEKLEAIKLEEQMEEADAITLETGKRLYEYALRNHKKIIITSDMYLSGNVIKRILEKNNYSGYEEIYLSSERKDSKATGKLFERIKIDNPKCRVLHIGDNVRTDLFNARRNGISAVII
ncbi:hypothetical protein [Butyrivibrio sp. AE3006]|uniref:hypothetical protein n=1 Tax=Butyrivibrio sp. AE3006 TaxID=1280673 RepID=UPI00041F2143|nr:hypothetical protein [Butyrivibrio sp. AE3006]